MVKDRPAPVGTSSNTTPSGRPVPPRQRKIALLGSRSVGKSSLAVQFCDEHFVDSYYPTIEEQFSKEFKYKGKEYLLEIQDTAGHDEFSILNPKYAIGVNGYIIVYSVASRASFEMVPIIRDKILSYSSVEKVPLCIVGNKNDLEVQRTVKTEEGQALAKKFGCAFTEASAKHNDNVANAFQLVVIEIEKELNPESAKTTSSGKETWGGWFKGMFNPAAGSSPGN